MLHWRRGNTDGMSASQGYYILWPGWLNPYSTELLHFRRGRYPFQFSPGSARPLTNANFKLMALTETVVTTRRFRRGRNTSPSSPDGRRLGLGRKVCFCYPDRYVVPSHGRWRYFETAGRAPPLTGPRPTQIDGIFTETCLAGNRGEWYNLWLSTGRSNVNGRAP